MNSFNGKTQEKQVYDLSNQGPEEEIEQDSVIDAFFCSEGFFFLMSSPSLQVACEADVVR